MSKTIMTNIDYRPQKFEDYMGQPQAVNLLREYVNLHNQTDRTVGHILLGGPSGTGKTTLARIMANEMGVSFHEIMATSIGSKADLVEAISRIAIEPKMILFIDEIHALSSAVQETLYALMEDFTLETSEGLLELPRFTIIGATTHTVNRALMTRFVTKVNLRLYNNEEITQMIKGSVPRTHGYEMPDDAARMLAPLAHGVARNAYALAKNYLDLVEAGSLGDPKTKKTREHYFVYMCQLHGFDPFLGLDARVRNYLRVLSQSERGMGLRTVSDKMRMEPETVSADIEQAAMQDFQHEQLSEIGIFGPLADLTGRGRTITDAGREYLALCKRMQNSGEGWFDGEIL